MTAKTKLFTREEKKTIRTIELDGVLHYVAVDVCKLLGHTSVPRVLKTFCNQTTMVQVTNLRGVSVPMKVIPKQDLIRLILASRNSIGLRIQQDLIENCLTTHTK